LPSTLRVPIVPPFDLADVLPIRMTRTASLVGALAALCVAGIAFAQYSQTPPAPPPSVGAEPKPAPAKPAEPPRRSPAKSAARAGSAATPKTHADDPECVYTGKRIVNSLARDDVDAAQKFMRFYEMFSCPSEHLRMAFRCTVSAGAPAPGKPLGDRVDQCWEKAPAQSKHR
jgi:hypothetical protein